MPDNVETGVSQLVGDPPARELVVLGKQHPPWSYCPAVTVGVRPVRPCGAVSWLV
jgi:hypothetical protein